MADIDTTYLDSDTDSIKAARPALLETTQRVNQLASSTGAQLIGTLRTLVGAVQTTLSKWLDYQNVSIFEFLSPTQIAEIQSGTSTLNITPYISQAISSIPARGGILEFPTGTYIFPTAVSTISSRNNITLVGDGIGKTIFKSTVAVGVNTAGTPVFTQFTTCNRITLKDITFDVNSILTTAANTLAIGFTFGNFNVVTNCEVLNGTRLGIGFNGTNNWVVTNCFIHKAGAAVGSYQNEGIFCTISGGAVQNGSVTNNVLSGWGMILSGNDLKVKGNIVTNWGYGGGITVNSDSGTNRSILTGNTCTGSTGIDLNDTQPVGIECWSPYAIISDNVCSNNAGTGIAFGGRYSNVSSNICVNNGSYNSTGSGISAQWQTGWASASDSIISNNTLGDTGTGYQKYGYSENQSAGATFSNMRVKNNSFFGNNTNTLYSPTATQIQFEGYVYEGKATYNPPSILKGNTDIGLTITVAGASLGDFVEVSAGGNLNGLTVSGNVIGSNAVQVLIYNGSTGPVDLGSTVFRARVKQFRS